MKILDRYLLSRYLGSFFFIVLLFSMLAVVIDFSDKIEDFIAHDGPSRSEIIFDYYLNFIPHINGLLFPLYTLIAVIFFTSRLAGLSEFVAMIGSGVNFYRLLWPYFLGAAIITTLHYFGNHYLFPQSNRTRVDFENTYVWKHNYEGPTENIHMFINPLEEVYIQYYNRRDSTGRKFMLTRYDSSNTKRISTLSAKRMELLEAPNHWRFRNIYRRYINSKGKESLLFEEELDTILPNLKTTDLVRRDNLKDAMTTNEIIEFIESEQEKGKGIPLSFAVERYRRTADPFTSFVLTFIGFAVASRKMRGGMGWHLVIGIGLGGVYIFMSKFSATFAISGGFPPMLAVWIPNILFSAVAALLIFKAQK